MNKIKPKQIIDLKRDEILPEISKQTLHKRYYWENEQSPQEIFARVACYYAKDEAQAKRLYNYFSNLWLIPSTPVLSNGGTNKGLPVSCYLNEVEDNIHSISDIFTENLYLAKEGGGIGTCWSKVRSSGEIIANRGQTSGIMPFLKVQDAQTSAISQGSLRRGSTAAYLHVSHPEIMEFLSIRKNSGDPSRRCPQIHHGVVITDSFMNAVKEDSTWKLIDSSGITKETLKARDIWFAILETRLETGEPYIIFIDTVNKDIPLYYEKLGKKVTTSNLCAEITLNTKNATGVCFLSSLNLAKYDSWKNDKYIMRDVFEFLDAIVDDFIDKTLDHDRPEAFSKARNSAISERSIGLGVMGFHSLLQSRMIDIESEEAKELNIEIFKRLRAEANEMSEKLAKEKGTCRDYYRCIQLEEIKGLRLIINELYNKINCFSKGDSLTHRSEAILEEFCTEYDISKNECLESLYQALFEASSNDDDEDFREAIAYLFFQPTDELAHKGCTTATFGILRDLFFIKFERSTTDSFIKGLTINLEGIFYNFPDYDAIEYITPERFSHKLAIAPTASISLIAGGVSPSIDPFTENSITVKTKNGASVIYNPELVNFLRRIGQNTDAVWSQIIRDDGSVKNLDFLDEHQKNVFKTAFEIDQNALVDLAADRAKFICQSQSLNLFILPDEKKSKISDFHFSGWRKGVKSFYYVRSKAMRKTEDIESCTDDICNVCQ